MFLCANSNQPWNSIIPTVVLLQNCKTSKDINQIHARLVTTGFINNTTLTTKIVLTFSSSPHRPVVEFARYIFFSHHASRIRQTLEDPFLWNAIIKSYSHGCDPREALIVFYSMLEDGVCADKFSFSLVLKACSRLGLAKKGMEIHGLLRKIEIGPNLFLQNCLIGMYIKCGCTQLARQVFDRMPTKDSVSYNSMIDGYVKHGMVDLALDLFLSMPLEYQNLISWNTIIKGYAQSEDGLKVACELFEKMPERDLISWNSMIDGFVKSGKMENAQALFDMMPERDGVSWANMIDGYAKLGRMDLARGLFDEMPEKDIVACNAIMAGYVQNGFSMETLDIFHYMQTRSNLAPDNTTLLMVLSAISQLGQIDNGITIHCYIEKNNFYIRGRLGVALIDMYSKCGSIENALLVFGDIQEKSVDHWNAMIGGLAIHGLGQLAFDFLMEMERLSVEPDDITFIGVLHACGHAGLVKEGLLCFELMRRVHNINPKLQHYGCMVDILGRAGQVEEAKRFIEDMPIEPNDVIWRTLLSACKNHNNLNVGEPVAKHLMRLDSCNSSSYVLLSNMYASLGMWNDVDRIRTTMKLRNLKKIPGCSWIELEGKVHEFFCAREVSSLGYRDVFFVGQFINS